MKNIEVLATGPLYPLALNGIGSAFTLVTPWQSGTTKDFLATKRAGIKGVASTGSHGPIGAAVFDSLPDLEIVSHFGVGYDNIDAAEAARRGIVVTNTPDVLTEEVADLTLGLLLATVRELPKAERYVRAGQWEQKPF